MSLDHNLGAICVLKCFKIEINEESLEKMSLKECGKKSLKTYAYLMNKE